MNQATLTAKSIPAGVTFDHNTTTGTQNWSKLPPYLVPKLFPKLKAHIQWTRILCLCVLYTLYPPSPTPSLLPCVIVHQYYSLSCYQRWQEKVYLLIVSILLHNLLHNFTQLHLNLKRTLWGEEEEKKKKTPLFIICLHHLPGNNTELRKWGNLPEVTPLGGSGAPTQICAPICLVP